MKHNLKICVAKDEPQNGIVRCRKVTMREKLLSLLFGRKERLMILVPGDSVESVAITELPAGGGGHE